MWKFFLDIFDSPNILPAFLELKNGGTIYSATFVVVTAIAQCLQGFIGWAFRHHHEICML